MERALALIADGTLSINHDGHIWRHAAIVHGRRVAVRPRRAENVGGKGYLRLTLQIDGELRGIGAHRVVWTYFNGPIPNKLQINHIDLNKQNNQPKNIELATAAENIQHSYRNGRPRPWSVATIWRGRPRLTIEQIHEARVMRAQGILLRDIASRFNISTTHAHRITS